MNRQLTIFDILWLLASIGIGVIAYNIGRRFFGGALTLLCAAGGFFLPYAIGELSDHFLNLQMRRQWAELKKHYKAGDLVTGKVIAHAACGYLVDIGERFHAVVDAIEIPRDQKNKSPAIGSAVTGKILSFTDHDKEIRIDPTALDTQS